MLRACEQVVARAKEHRRQHERAAQRHGHHRQPEWTCVRQIQRLRILPAILGVLRETGPTTQSLLQQQKQNKHRADGA